MDTHDHAQCLANPTFILRIGHGALFRHVQTKLEAIAHGTDLTKYLMAIESNCWIFGVFGFGYKYLNKPSKALSYLSKAAYPVYIIHMFVLYAGGLIILPLEIHPMLKFITVVTFTGIICYLIYEFIIRRIGFFRPLFGLKWQFNKVEKQISDDNLWKKWKGQMPVIYNKSS